MKYRKISPGENPVKNNSKRYGGSVSDIIPNMLERDGIDISELDEIDWSSVDDAQNVLRDLGYDIDDEDANDSDW